MLSLVFPNGTLLAGVPDVEERLNRARLRKGKKPLNYWIHFDESGAPERIGHNQAAYTIDWQRHQCTCPVYRKHGACKHLDALVCLLPRLVRVRCEQCYGDGYDGELEPCDRCLGEGYTWTLLPPQVAPAGAR